MVTHVFCSTSTFIQDVLYDHIDKKDVTSWVQSFSGGNVSALTTPDLPCTQHPV